ncbi:Leucine-, isoleucine-, valine-, threonine-, and alanine-binding protein [Anaerolineales bacterium]|nr:Leucine-, isoleucine-, valine-, threonine-, and alanine-binding protein [Anaerolineales bacterium]
MKTMHKLFMVLVVVSMLLTACQSGSDTIKVAVLAPLSGAVPTFGTAMKNGVELATEEWNAKGGVLGKQIELVIADSQCEADPAVNAANKVIDQDGVKYIIGELCSKASIPVSEIAEAKSVVQISGSSTNVNVTLNVDGSTKKFVYRTCFIDPFQGLVGAKFAYENLGAKTAFIMLDQGNDYVRGLAEAFEESFTGMGGTVVGKETYTSTDTDFSAILSKVQEAKPDVIFLPDYYPIVNLVGAQAKQMGVTAPMLGGDGWDSPDLSPASAAGGYFVNHYTSDSTAPIVVDFVGKYKAKYGSVPDAIAALAYDAANVMYAGIEAAGKDDAAAVTKAVEGLTWEGVTGKITFDEFHNPIKGAVVMKVTEDGVTYEASVQP